MSDCSRCGHPMERHAKSFFSSGPEGEVIEPGRSCNTMTVYTERPPLDCHCFIADGEELPEQFTLPG